MRHIVILGGGYGGLLSALTLRKYFSSKDIAITLVNKAESHEIITELHRLAVGNVSEKAVALPLSKLLRNKEIRMRIDVVKDIDPEQKQVRLASGGTVNYDALVIALGSQTAFFGIPGLESNSFTLKSVKDARRLHRHIENRVEQYRKNKEIADATFVIGGGGLTGIELIGELADMLPQLCQRHGVNFRDISLYCVESGPTILKGFSSKLVERARQSLENRGVQFLTGVAVTEVRKGFVLLKDGQLLETNTMVWTGGVQGNEVVASSGLEVQRGRATVNEFLQSTSHPDVFLAGDSAIVIGPEGRPYPPTAQLAWQMGETVGYNTFAYLKGMSMEVFSPVFSGTLASLGRKDAIGTIGESKTCVTGLPASIMKEASNLRYLSHIKGLFALAY